MAWWERLFGGRRTPQMDEESTAPLPGRPAPDSVPATPPSPTRAWLDAADPDVLAFVTEHWDDAADAIATLLATLETGEGSMPLHGLRALAWLVREHPMEVPPLTRQQGLPADARAILTDPIAWWDDHPLPAVTVDNRRTFQVPELWAHKVDVLGGVECAPEAVGPLLALTLLTVDRCLGRLLRERCDVGRAREHGALVTQGSVPDLHGLWLWAAQQIDEGSLDSDCDGVMRLYANLLSKTIDACRPNAGVLDLGAWSLLVGQMAGLRDMPDGSLYDALDIQVYESWMRELREQPGVRFDRVSPPPSLPRGRHAEREPFELPDWTDAYEVTGRLDLTDRDFRDAQSGPLADLLTRWLLRSVHLWKALPDSWELSPALGAYEERMEVLQAEGLSDDFLEDLWAWLVRAGEEDGRPPDAVLVLQLGANVVLTILEKHYYNVGGFDGGLLGLLAWLSRLSGAATAATLEGAVDTSLAKTLAAEAAQLT